MRALIVAAVAVAAFCSGYAVCSYRYSRDVLPTLQTMIHLGDANMSLTNVALIDKGALHELRRKLLVEIKSELAPSYHPSFHDLVTWRAIPNLVLVPFHDGQGIAEVDAVNEKELSELNARLQALCDASAVGEAPKFACGAK